MLPFTQPMAVMLPPVIIHHTMLIHQTHHHDNSSQTHHHDNSSQTHHHDNSSQTHHHYSQREKELMKAAKKTWEHQQQLDNETHWVVGGGAVLYGGSLVAVSGRDHCQKSGCISTTNSGQKEDEQQ